MLIVHFKLNSGSHRTPVPPGSLPSLKRFAAGRWLLSVCFILAGFSFAATAQISLNVTNYGGRGDAISCYVNTVSNSVVVTTTNQLSAADIGKTMEVFGVGRHTYGLNSYGATTDGWQDVIATITNVVNGTNVYLKVTPQDGSTNFIPSRTMTAWATYGTDNHDAFARCIAAAGGYTNAVINIPNGKYLTMSYFGVGYGENAICIQRGGLHFLGESRDGTVLLSRGAWQSYYGVAGGHYPFRGYLFEIMSPVTNGAVPLILENLTLDGGVGQGMLNVHGIQCNQTDGLGWDEQHGAYLTFDQNGQNSGTVALQMLTNVNVVHWRGEMIKSIDQNTNGTIDIENCLFGDGAATALNVYPRWNVRNNVFSNLWQVTEYYQKFYRGTAYFCNNLITNDANLEYPQGYFGNSISINGGNWSASPLVIQSNILYSHNYGYNVFITTPAANVSFLNNEIHAPPFGYVFNLNAPGSQGDQCDSNILISANSIYGSGSPAQALVGFGSNSGTNANNLDLIYDLTVCSNYVAVPSGLSVTIWPSQFFYRVHFHDNVFNGAVGPLITGYAGTGIPYVLVETNNVYTPQGLYLPNLATNTVSYANGPKCVLGTVKTGNLFVLDDTNTNQIPAGAWLCLDNRNNQWPQNGYGGGDMSGNVMVYPSRLMTNSLVLSNGSAITFYWNGGSWVTNRLSPPANFRLLN